MIRPARLARTFKVLLLRNPWSYLVRLAVCDELSFRLIWASLRVQASFLYTVRHAQGIHNVEGEKNHAAYLSPALFDAHLTPLGWDQVHNLRKHVHECGLDKKIDLVIVSPLLRTMQTAVGVFGGENYVDGIHASPLMVANAGNSDHPAISSLNCPSFLAVETCREHLGVHPCDKRRSINEYRTLFPAIDFSLIESDEDILWTAETREANEDVAARGMKFMNWLWTRKEKEIAICHADEHIACSTNGSDSSATNYPGKIPRGPDLPSDVPEEKLGTNST
ncbi:hypothetical protein ACLOJK_036162 [Asimina triloba]